MPDLMSAYGLHKNMEVFDQVNNCTVFKKVSSSVRYLGKWIGCSVIDSALLRGWHIDTPDFPVCYSRCCVDIQIHYGLFHSRGEVN
jgi:hypothetical protein